MKKYYNKLAKQYNTFYGTDLYSVKEDKAIADIIKKTIKFDFGKEKVVIGDFGCGVGLPRSIYNVLFNENIEYTGFDISSGMIEEAKINYSKEVRQGKARFSVGDITEILPGLPDNYFDIVFMLHGVPSYIDPKKLPLVVKELSRIVNGYTVLDFMGKYAAIREPLWPKQFSHTDRRLVSQSPPILTTYSTKEIKALLHYCGLDLVVVQGMNIIGGSSYVHNEFIEQQRKLGQRELKGESVEIEMKKLHSDIEKVIEIDLEIGKIFPNRGHDILVIAKNI